MEKKQLNDNFYVEHDGTQYLYYEGWFYKCQIGGQLSNVIDKSLRTTLASMIQTQQTKAATA